MNQYKIIATCDPYNSSKFRFFEGFDVLKYDGATPVMWVVENNSGYGYTLNEARAILMRYANDDAWRNGERTAHKYFDTSYTSDCITYRIVAND